MPHLNAKTRFAQFSGAKLFTPKSAPSGEIQVDLPPVVESDDSSASTPAQPSYIQESFKRPTALWKNPKVTLGVVSVIAILIAATGTAIFNGHFSLPTFQTASQNTAPTDDDTTPKPHSDGDWQAAALSGGLSEGFEREKNQTNPFLTTKPKGNGAKPMSKAKAPKSLAMGAPVTPTYYRPPATSTLPPTRSIPTTPLRLPSRSYVPLPVRPATLSARPTISAKPTLPSHTPATTTEASPEDRRLAVLAATSSGNGQSSPLVPSATTTESATASGAPSDPNARYQPVSYLASEAAVLDGVPQQLISRSQRAKGRLLLGVAFTPGDAQFMQGQTVEVEVEDPLESGLPKGAHIIASVDLPGTATSSKNAVVRLIPTALAIGDAEYPLLDEATLQAIAKAEPSKSIPQSPLILAGKNGKPLIAKRQGSEFLRFLGETVKSLAGGIGNTIASIGLTGGTGLLSSIPTSQIIGSVTGTLQPTSTSAIEVLALRENTQIEIRIVQPLSLPQGILSTDIVPALSHTPLASQPNPPESASADSLAAMPTQPEMSDGELAQLLQQVQPTVIGAANGF